VQKNLHARVTETKLLLGCQRNCQFRHCSVWKKGMKLLNQYSIYYLHRKYQFHLENYRNQMQRTLLIQPAIANARARMFTLR